MSISNLYDVIANEKTEIATNIAVIKKTFTMCHTSKQVFGFLPVVFDMNLDR